MPKSKTRQRSRLRRLAAERKFNADTKAAFDAYVDQCPECNPGGDQVLDADKPRVAVHWL